MRDALTILAALAAASLAQAAGVVKLESPPKPEWVSLTADPVVTTLSVDAAGTWVLFSDESADLRPSTDGKTATFVASKPGRYRLAVFTAKEVHRVEVVVGNAPPVPPGPGPGPGPDPAPPADPLLTALQAAYDAETAADKATALVLRVELYRQMIGSANDPAIATAGQLLTVLQQAGDSLDRDRLPAVRKVLRAELQAGFPEDVTLTAAEREKAVKLFTRLHAALSKVKP